jgi:hypothetical protein
VIVPRDDKLSTAIAALRVTALHRAARHFRWQVEAADCRVALDGTSFAEALNRLERFSRYPRWLNWFLKRTPN